MSAQEKNAQKIEQRIRVVEMEISFLRSLGRSPDPETRIVTAEVELAREAEVTALKRELEELKLAA